MITKKQNKRKFETVWANIKLTAVAAFQTFTRLSDTIFPQIGPQVLIYNFGQ